ncbi:MAG: ApbE family lipoprotein [Polynucleobacter sp. 24-46-87]|jgi:thiamine biosynthesis lipoprotein|nr:MAG: ApbE family lipoprotein [Polynucleobacter sp. 35-46-207]OZA10443.1 MAG: ApbE family lipoprotein [Polynucleobacter sp. 24-46-87]OZA41573.1 MAG: ApbE family lipoprotein [Polynucleobacter sp. 17-46-58]OZB47127.1 MAG: ApbE family lipoprotein [Polynucleobacter sp. 39-45-136]
MKRCKPLLGTYVEIACDDGNENDLTVEAAFNAIETVQSLMGFHNLQSELSRINRKAHREFIAIHPWTAKVLAVAQEMHQRSGGLFNCGIGQHLIEKGLLPQSTWMKQQQFGGIENIHFIAPCIVQSSVPICLDLGGIAKGFAVDVAVQALQEAGIQSGCVNAGGDMRVFGASPQSIHIRNPSNPSQCISLGQLQDGAIATSALYFTEQDYISKSFMINPLTSQSMDFSGSYSVIAPECIYADALTKVISLSGDVLHPCLEQFSAQAIWMTAS